MIYLGTSGYSYADWKGIYYPEALPKQDWLAFYASEFDAVELNFTYYRMPVADHLLGLARQTGDDFRFAVKAHQDITHKRQDLAALAEFRAAVDPLQQAGKLGAVLLQFPNAFQNSEENANYVQTCCEQLDGLPLAVEFRHSSWLTQRTLGLLREWNAAFCNVDMPALPGLLPKTAFATASLAYVRFHGRNTVKWWEHEQAWERYNYTYTEEELQEWVPHLVEMGDQAENLFVFANNHWQGQAVSTARQLKLLLDRESA
jgi:uncharacterized protein YecE (DUF72 family)